uniref:Uncharacterized protein n=1 Tax=Ditylenchus dipsaci TaxID=166011 RepID=A0A915E8Y9_9BILA
MMQPMGADKWEKPRQGWIDGSNSTFQGDPSVGSRQKAHSRLLLSRMKTLNWRTTSRGAMRIQALRVIQNGIDQADLRLKFLKQVTHYFTVKEFKF